MKLVQSPPIICAEQLRATSAAADTPKAATQAMISRFILVFSFSFNNH
jgi:hypothetical protein